MKKARNERKQIENNWKNKFNVSVGFEEITITNYKNAELLKPSAIEPVITTIDKSN